MDEIAPRLCKVCGCKLDLDVDAEVFVGCTEKDWMAYILQTFIDVLWCIDCVPAVRV
jgi:hypothetical protein